MRSQSQVSFTPSLHPIHPLLHQTSAGPLEDEQMRYALSLSMEAQQEVRGETPPGLYFQIKDESLMEAWHL